MKGWKRPILIVLATLPIGLIAFIMLFMARSEMAFDEARCPFEQGELRLVREGVAVREDARTCQEGVEERRWVLLREGRAPHEIARRRMDAQYFEGDYGWSASDEDDNVVLTIRNPGQEPRVFRERPLAETAPR